jgi:hypothetical protein
MGFADSDGATTMSVPATMRNLLMIAPPFPTQWQFDRGSRRQSPACPSLQLPMMF